MARGINKAIILGAVGQTPEARYLQDGSCVTSLSLATSESWKDKNSGEKIEKTEWHRVNFWGKSAEIVCQYVSKGDKLYVEGKLHTRRWTDKDGIDRYSIEIRADQFQLLGERREQQAQARPQPARQQQVDQEPNPFDDIDQDIPF